MPRSLPPATDNSGYRPDVRVHRRLLAVLLSAAAVSITDDLLTKSGGSVPSTQAASAEIHSKVLALLAGR
jgi:hypothetical protein